MKGKIMSLKVHDVAEILSLHPNTVRYLEKDGKIKAYRDLNNFRVFKKEDVEKYRLERAKLREV